MTRFNISIVIAVIAVLVSFIAVNTASAQLSQYGREQAQKQQALEVMAIQKPGPKTTYGGHIDPVIKNQKMVWRRSAGINVSLGGAYDFSEYGGVSAGAKVSYEKDKWFMFLGASYGQYSYKDFDYNGQSVDFGIGIPLFKLKNNPNCKGDQYITGFQINLYVGGVYDYLNTGNTENVDNDGYFVKSHTFGGKVGIELQQQIAEFVSGDHTVPMYIAGGYELKATDGLGDKSTIDLHHSVTIRLGFKF